MVPIIQNLVSAIKYAIKCPYTMNSDYITVHNTGNDAPARNEVSYMIGNNKKVSFHYAVDDIEIIQGIPTNRSTWNAGDGANGKGNRKSESVEICYSKSGGERFLQAERNAAEFIASRLKEKGWGIDRVRTHNSWNGKNCPSRTLQLGWDRFLGMINGYLNGTQAIVKAREINPFKEPLNVLRYNKLTQFIAKEDVKWLQWELNQAGYDLKIDGKYGIGTYTAFIGYQKANGLVQDGACGQLTRTSLKNN